LTSSNSRQPDGGRAIARRQFDIAHIAIHDSYVRDADVERLREQIKALNRRMRQEQPAVPGLSPTELQLLAAVERADGAATPGQLAADLGMRSSNVAATLRSLEALGTVRRQGDPEDRRRTLLHTTEQGRKLVVNIRRNRRTWLREAMAQILTEEEQRLLFQAGELMQRLADDFSTTVK
jgi:DNA-binding MarR family transcriptional regulator